MRTCIFCQGRASSREDIWPQWLIKCFPLSNASYMEGERGGYKLGTWRNKNSRLLLSKCVCKSCKEGWMSKIESEMKPIVNSIHDEQIRVLDVPSQAVISVWAIKTAMALESLYPEREFFYSEYDRQNMRRISAIPERTTIWIAKCVNQSNIYSAAKDLHTAPGVNEVKAYLTTMAFGSLALQILSLKTTVGFPKKTSITYETQEGPWNQTLLQVWPLSQYTKQWPPTYGLDGEWGLETLAQRLSPKINE